MNIWGDEARTCEQDRKNQRNACNNKCLSDPYPQMCEDKCAAEYANDLAKERLEFHERKIKIYLKLKKAQFIETLGVAHFAILETESRT